MNRSGGSQNVHRYLASGCSHEMHTFSPSKLTVGQILSRPLTSPPTSAERKAATHVVKRLIRLSADSPAPKDIVKLPTAGQVRIAMANIHQAKMGRCYKQKQLVLSPVIARVCLVYINIKYTSDKYIVYTFPFVVRPLNLVKVTSPRVSSAGPCLKMVWNCTKEVSFHRSIVGGGCNSHVATAGLYSRAIATNHPSTTFSCL